MDNDNIKFNSIEEAKEFLSTEDLSSLGAVSFMDSNGESISLTFEQFVQMLGIDKVAEFLFNNQENMIQKSVSEQEAIKLIERFTKEPETLTDEEKVKVYMILETIQEQKLTKVDTVKNKLFEAMTKYLMIDEDLSLTSKISGVIALLITYLEAIAISSIDTFEHIADNNIVLDEMIAQAEQTVKVQDDVDEGVLLIGLIHAIGNNLLTKQKMNKKVNYSKLIDMLQLNKSFIYECPGCEEEDCSTCDKKETVDLEKILERDYASKNKETITDSLINKSLEKLREEVKTIIPAQATPISHSEMDKVFNGITESIKGKKKVKVDVEESKPKKINEPINIRERLKNRK